MAWIDFLAPAAAAVGKALDRRATKKNIERTLQANKELAAYQYSQDLEMWNKGNIYNSPEAQMERLKTAGLNPNLVYGGNAPGNASGQLPKYNAPTADFTGIPASLDPVGMLTMFQDFTVKQAQVDNLREQNKVIREQQVISHAKGLYQERISKGTALSIDRKSWGDLYRSELAGYKAGDFFKEAQQREQLRPYQLEYMKGKARASGLQHDVMRQTMDKTQTQIEFQNLQNEWYLTKLFGGMIGQGIGAVSKFLGPGAKIGAAGKAGNILTRSPLLNIKRFKGGQRYRKFTPE